jgi:ferredoxin
MTTNNEAFEIWYESRFGKEGLKTALNHPYLLDGEYVYESTKDKLFIWQAATTEANKRIAELEVQLQNWKDFSKKVQNIDFNDYLQLQASNNHLREAFNDLAAIVNRGSPSCQKGIVDKCKCTTCVIDRASATPAQSLALHDNEVIERCAKVCDENAIESREFAEPFAARVTALLADEIRALKDK